NWALNSSNGATTFIDSSDLVVFDDTASASNTTVNISSGTVHPSAITFNNLTNSYTVQGAGAIGGTTGITVQGGGLVTVANVNSYTGLTAINAGTLNFVNGA